MRLLPINRLIVSSKCFAAVFGPQQEHMTLGVKEDFPMSRRFVSLVLLVLLVAISVGGALGQEEGFVFGCIYVGPEDDHGWSEAHHNDCIYVKDNIPGARMLSFESLNTADTPETTLEQVVDNMVESGAQLIFATADAFEKDIIAVAEKYPDIPFINSSGSQVLHGINPPNLGNIMPQIEHARAVAGCSAALVSENGKIASVGPLINGETRRVAASTYLGARYCWEHYRGRDPGELEYNVVWIGFWFNIPGITLDPTEVVNQFFDAGYDVVVNDIDTTEALVEAQRRWEQGERVFATGYEYPGACREGPNVCLGVPVMNWGPSYLATAQSVIAGTWTPEWLWLPPNWEDVNNDLTSHTGYIMGPALTEEQEETLWDFVALLAREYEPVVHYDELDQDGHLVLDGHFALWQGPLAYQDGTPIAEKGEWVNPSTIWHLEQLLQGMRGASVSK